MFSILFLPLLFLGGFLFLYFFPGTSTAKSVAGSSSYTQTVAAAPATTSATTVKKNPVDAAELQMVFSTFDKNGDGFITKQELQESLESLGLFGEEKHVADIVDNFDANQDGLIDLHEFQALYQEMASPPEDEHAEQGKDLDDLKEAFDVFDDNGDGLITGEELGLVMSTLGLSHGPDDCKNMIKKVDTDGDGKVNFDEFKVMMQSARGLRGS